MCTCTHNDVDWEWRNGADLLLLPAIITSTAAWTDDDDGDDDVARNRKPDETRSVCVCVVETGLGRRLDGPPTLPKHKLRLPIMSMLPTAHSLQNSQTSCLLFKNKNRFCTSPEKTIHYFNNRRVKQRNGQIRLKLFKMKKRDVSRVPRRGTSSKWSRKSRPMKIVFRFRCKVSREGDY